MSDSRPLASPAFFRATRFFGGSKAQNPFTPLGDARRSRCWQNGAVNGGSGSLGQKTLPLTHEPARS